MIIALYSIILALEREERSDRLSVSQKIHFLFVDPIGAKK
jgi:hypothetical protein